MYLPVLRALLKKTVQPTLWLLACLAPALQTIARPYRLWLMPFLLP